MAGGEGDGIRIGWRVSRGGTTRDQGDRSFTTASPAPVLPIDTRVRVDLPEETLLLLSVSSSTGRRRSPHPLPY